MHRYSIVVFLSAFLLFQIQPLVARVILPWFGGTASVWNTCMMFFQIVLLLGYLYAHGLRIFLKPRTSWWVHCGVLLLAMLCLPAIPGDALQPQDAGAVAWGIVKVLSLSIGLPFFVLATTGPLIQAWHNASDGIAESKQESGQSRAGSPYRLYALSNIGSLLALLSYPFLIEPFLPIRTQSILWSLLFVAFGSLCFFSGAQVRNCESWNLSLIHI